MRIAGKINYPIQQQKPLEENTAAYCFIGEIDLPITADGILVVESVSVEIMLGETKYFGVKKKNETGKIKIEEIKTNYGDEPKFPADSDGWIWQKTDVWGINPINIVECDTCGRKMGVYWEKEKPMVNGQNLPNGLIRLVGRYWHSDSTYIVTLRTLIENSEYGFVKIVVIRPSQLLSEGQIPTYKTSTNVLGKPFSVDSLCIYWGGLYGIPPQMLKGHMLKESHFKPSYRYEPYTNQFNVESIVKKDQNPFIVSDLGMGKPGAKGVPNLVEHKGVRERHYIMEKTTVWSFIISNSQLIDPNSPNDFGRQQKGGRLKGQIANSKSYSILNDYSKIFLPDWIDSIKTRNKIKTTEELSDSLQIIANDSARIAFLKYLQYDWKDKDLDKIYAQTRIASSYGLLQILYTTSLSEGYDLGLNDRPENLNEPDGFKYQIYHYSSRFKKNGFNLDHTNNFNSSFKYYDKKGKLIFEAGDGFEGSFRT
ncbi:MAG TPA: hypothetical protein PKD03_15230, partial [Ignavibacteriaceae bacterium]|nr:hypothetical protein [Ignavibacteriaceae bacterium]